MDEEILIPITQYKCIVSDVNIVDIVNELDELGFTTNTKLWHSDIYYMYVWPLEMKFGFFKDLFNYKEAEGHIEKAIEEIIG